MCRIVFFCSARDRLAARVLGAEPGALHAAARQGLPEAARLHRRALAQGLPRLQRDHHLIQGAHLLCCMLSLPFIILLWEVVRKKNVTGMFMYTKVHRVFSEISRFFSLNELADRELRVDSRHTLLLSALGTASENTECSQPMICIRTRTWTHNGWTMTSHHTCSQNLGP